MGTFSATLTTAGSQTLTATDTATTSITGTAINHGQRRGGDALRSQRRCNDTAGTAFNFTVTAEDPFNNTATGYAGTVKFTSSDSGNALLPAGSPLTAGVGTFSVTLKTAGSQTLTATDTVDEQHHRGQQPDHGQRGGCDAPSLVSGPTTATAGTPFSFTVTAEDQFNNTATGYTGTVAFTSSDSQASCCRPAPRLTGGVGNVQCHAEDGRQPDVDRHGHRHTPASRAPAARSRSAPPRRRTSQSSCSDCRHGGHGFNFTVTAEDQFNNTATGYTGTVSFTSSDGGTATCAGPAATLTTGVGTFSVTLRRRAARR